MDGRMALQRLLPEFDPATLERPTNLAEGLPGRVFTDPAFFEHESRQLFGRNWIAVGFGADVPDVGDVMPVSVAGWELLLVRGADKQVRCFHNICRHRGMKLVHEKSNVASLRCGWHCWTYDLDGALVATPNIAGIRTTAADGFDRTRLGLRPVRCGQWFDLVLVDIGGTAPPLARHLAPLAQRLARVEFDHCTHDGTVTEADAPVNWKVIVEGGIEDYHLPFVHRTLTYSDSYRFEEGGEAYLGFSTRRSADEAYKRYHGEGDPTEVLPIFPGLRGASELESLVLFVLPNAIVAALPTHVRLTALLPQGPARTLRRQACYFVDEAGCDPRYAALRERTHGFWREIWQEDSAYMDAIQHMSPVRDRIGQETRFSPHWERGVHAFQKYVVRRLSA